MGAPSGSRVDAETCGAEAELGSGATIGSSRSYLKRAAERLLLLGPAWVARARRRGHSLILAYHDVVPDGAPIAGEASLHVPRRRFAEHLDVISRRADVVSLRDLFERTAQGRRPRVAITFDDAYRGTVTAGIEELVSRGLPATVFVVPGRLGGRGFWWDLLADPSTGELPPGARDEALGPQAGRQEEVLAWAGTVGLPVFPGLPPHALSASEAELERAAGEPGITVGSHTWSHPNLARLSDAECAEEIERSVAWLEARFSSFIPWISYPYGYESPAACRAAREAGCEGGLLITGGWLATGELDRYRLPRLNVPAGLSSEGLELRLSGLLNG